MSEFLQSLLSYFDFENLNELVTQIGIKLLLALGVVLLGWLAMRFLIGWVTRALERMNFPDPTVRGVIALLLKWAIILATAYYVMLVLGVQTTAILGIVTGSALAIGLAMQGTLSNVASGIMLLILRPMSVGEYIQGGGHEGTVVTIGIFYTTLDTVERYRVSIPNGALFSSAIVNLTRNPNLVGRVLLGVAYDADLDRVQTLLVKATQGVDGVLTDPPVQVLVQDLADSAVNLEIRFHAHRDNLWPAIRDVRQGAKIALDEAGIEIPFPQTTVHYRPQP